jgi:hypothetical protein
MSGIVAVPPLWCSQIKKKQNKLEAPQSKPIIVDEFHG